MKNFLSFFVITFLLSFSYSSFAQIVLPDYDNVCPDQEIEYTVQSSYYGDGQEFYVHNGVFIVADSLYQSTNDSTHIVMDITPNTNTFKVRWGNDGSLGGIYLNDNQSYECNIYNSYYSFLWSADTVVLTGPQSFYIEIKVYNADVNNTITNNSSNIVSVNEVKITSIPGSNDAIYRYRCDITGSDSGWVKFITSGPASQNCPSITSNVIRVDVSRKLHAPTLSFSGCLLCNDEDKTFSINSDPNAEDYTWSVSNGLKISVGENLYSTYTTSSTNVTIKAQTTTPGTETISVKSNGGNNYEDSDTQSAEIWHGKPNPDQIIYYNVGPNYPAQYEICIDFPNDGKALYDNSCASVLEYQWDALDWNIIQHPMDPFPAVNMQDVQITAPGYGYSIGDRVYFTIRARNRCGWGEWKYPKLELEAVNCNMYMMTVSPNPADSYINVSFADSELSTEEQSGESSINQIVSSKKVRKSKTGVMEEYLVQILDKNGTVRKSVHSKAMNLNIDTHDLEPGTYFLHLNWNNEVVKQQLIIQ
ncbi:T9SS type A sorting domain-containing protein [Prolixibacteraceae bacterium Z1-6]|uniref:T9SS type A sorting domain-containing protein n=1 Tax=Draconibacterium aestuarii TaxID=2998507 RepID=A0A9X3J6J6_9BACT|nr:T9SS type A sorting domain-containing protein [Prolixibacteraceae bacterium Z1-6]